jgi:hypothetical protein
MRQAYSINGVTLLLNIALQVFIKVLVGFYALLGHSFIHFIITNKFKSAIYKLDLSEYSTILTNKFKKLPYIRPWLNHYFDQVNLVVTKVVIYQPLKLQNHEK